MLDSKGRKFIEPIISKIAKVCVKLGISANVVTFLAFIIGLVGAYCLYCRNDILAILLLWISGLFDVIDGSVARISKKQSLLGAQFDIVSDRIVELSYFWSLALTNRDSVFAIMFLISMAFISMTVFLTTGMISKNETKKSFYYQAGLMERTEGFIATTIMILFKNNLIVVAYGYGILILITIIQRVIDTIKINSRDEL